MATFEIFRDKSDEFRFRLKAGNGQIILASEGYKAKAGAENGIASVKTNAPDDARYGRKESKGGEPYFVLKAKNDEVIGMSEMYSSKTAMETGIDSVKTNGPIAGLVDQT